MEKKYVAPGGMANTVASAVAELIGAVITDDDAKRIAEAVLKYQAEHPPVPSDEQWNSMRSQHQWPDNENKRKWLLTEWMRIAYLAPEPEIPEAIERLMWDSKPSSYNSMPDATHNGQIIEAYEIGDKVGYERGLRAGRQG